MSHLAVMTKELLEHLAPKDGGVYVDGSFGGGGHTRAVLESANCSVIALDKDPAAIARGRVLQEKFAERLMLVHGCFSNLEKHLAEKNVAQVDGVSLMLAFLLFSLMSRSAVFLLARTAR